MQITTAQFKSLFPKADPALVPFLNETFTRYKINTEDCVAAFLSQAGHESMGFTKFTENLNYSAQGLLATFKKYYTPALAAQHARKPETIANHVYANRMGNGPAASGEGWLYRGRGAFHLTGKDNYEEFAKDMGITLPQAVALCETLRGGVISAGWFWAENNLHRFADAKDVVGLTEKINGGHNGLAERKALYEAAKRVL